MAYALCENKRENMDSYFYTTQEVPYISIPSYTSVYLQIKQVLVIRMFAP